MSTDFYIGYDEELPPAHARLMRRVAVGLVLTAAAVATLVLVSQRPFARAVFEFGQPRARQGTVARIPYAALVPTADRNGDRRWPLLVEPGKTGGGQIASEFGGQMVSFEGTRIARGDSEMLEVLPDSIRPLRALTAPAVPASSAVVDVSLAGEIVDGKCFLGVMKPGDRQTHRDCAVRCLSGGIPPLLVTRDAAGGERLFLLAGERGDVLRPRRLEGLVAVPVRVSGRLTESGGWPVIRLHASNGQPPIVPIGR